MSADLSDRTGVGQLAGANAPAESSAPWNRTALDRPAAIAAAPRPRIGRDGKPKRRLGTSLWRLRHYMSTYRARFIAMVCLAALGVGVAIVVPLAT